MTVRVPAEPWCDVHLVDRLAGANLCGQTDPDLVTDAIDLASEVLYYLSGRKWPGLVATTLTARFDAAGCTSCARSMTGWEVRDSQQAIAWSGYYRAFRRMAPMDIGCGCEGRTDLNLLAWPHWPARQIVAVTIDGIPHPDLTEFEIIDRRALNRKAACWPAGVDIVATVKHGRRVPRGGQIAAAEFAVHWLRAHGAAGDCQLPDMITSMSREDLTITAASPADYSTMRDGLSGLPWVDRWLGAVMASKGRGPRPLVLSRAAPPVWYGRK